MKTQISFNQIKNLFPENEWDVGYLSADAFKQVVLTPIKSKLHPTGEDYSNNIHYPSISNAIVLIKIGSIWDYTFYDDALKIIQDSGINNCTKVYTNFKEAAIHSGIGVRARNSLVYSYKFGFDCHICVFKIDDEIIDIPTNKRVNYKLWSRCKGCDDCVKACPVGAIHGTKEPYWLDSSECDQFISNGTHPTIPSIKSFWHKNLYPEISQNIIDKVISNITRLKYLRLPQWPWDRNGYTYDGQVTRKNGVPVDIPVCRECTSQPKCSKWGGAYPYDNLEATKTIIWHKRKIND